MLFDRRLAGIRAQLFDVGGHGHGLDLREFQPTPVAPVEELLYRARVSRARVSHARVAVTDTGGEEFDEAAAGALTAGADPRRRGALSHR